MGFDPFVLKQAVVQKPSRPTSSNYDDSNDLPVRILHLVLELRELRPQSATLPLRTVYFDIFSAAGDSDVMSQVDRLSFNETKIAPRSVRIAVLRAWGRSVIIFAW